MFDQLMRAGGGLVSAAARDVAGQIFSGGGTWLRPPRWYQALTVQMLPERLRMEFGLCFDEHGRSTADRALAWIRRVYPPLTYAPSHRRTLSGAASARARKAAARMGYSMA